MTNSSFLKNFFFAVSIVFFVSCDNDFNEIGADIVGDDVHSDMIRQEINVVAYDRATGAVQSNNMALNQLGILDNPVFGKTVSHFVTQIEFPANLQNPSLYEPELDSVYVYVPYYSSAVSADSNTGVTTYELDSIYGKADGKFKLSVYRNGYYLRDADPADPQNVQRYFSDDRQMVENLKGTLLAENAEFSFSPLEIQRSADPDQDGVKEPKVVERLAPGIFMNLDKAAMQEAIFSEAAKPNLLNNNIFQNYFRGLYFKAEQTGDAVMGIPKFTDGTITLKYRDYEIKIDGTPDMTKAKIVKTMTFNLKTNTINFFDNTYTTGFSNAIASSNVETGDSRLYLKGGAGSMAVINLDTDDLNALKEDALGEEILVNEANLVFHIDKGAMAAAATEPLRIYLYDLNNKRTLIDYATDGSSSTSLPKYNKTIHGGIIALDDAGRGTQYKIRITNHIANIIKRDSTNVKLGLVVTENINVTSNYRLKTPFSEGSGDNITAVKDYPLYSILHPYGTVLYGNNVPAEENDKRLKLEIFYTKPKQ